MEYQLVDQLVLQKAACWDDRMAGQMVDKTGLMTVVGKVDRLADLLGLSRAVRLADWMVG